MYVYQKLWLSDRFLETPSQWQPIGLLPIAVMNIQRRYFEV